MYVSKVYQMAVDSYGDVRTLVVGITYQRPDDWEYIMDSLNEDSNLYLIKEPDNPKDPLAIAVYLDDKRVGYVAASDNGKIWLYLTDEKMPCTYLESFGASFKISFENPRALFEDMPFEEIYRDKDGVTEESYAHFDIPFLTNPKDKNYDWFDDRTYIMDLEQYIPDFRRKLAARLIVLVGRKNSKGEYRYYLPYANNPVADVRDDIVKGVIDRFGFAIALPDVPVINTHGSIIMDLHVTYIKDTNFKDFDLANHSELVFNLISEYDYKKQNAVNNQSSANSKNNKGCKNESNEENDLFLQEPESTPSFSKSDYILKKGETINYSIDKDSFEKIDRITTELYTFVRNNLLPSMELFGFMKKQTPYAMLISDFKHYEILIKIFIIKDLGRIYKGLNHSVNIDTAEGKALLLYMDKDLGNTTEIPFETFKEVCNPKTRIEPAKKMRGILEELMTSYYESDIELWTNTDFMIHSFLKDVNKEWTKRYLEIMRQFASAIKGTNKLASDSSTNSSRGSMSIMDEFFPLFGVTLGKTTWKQVEDMGYKVKIWQNGKSRIAEVGNIDFWDFNGVGVFTSLAWHYHDYNYTDFTHLWKSKGFSWELSYDGWVDVFKKLGFEITVNKQPMQRESSGRKTLCAEFEALSPDGTWLFTLTFDYGENGYFTSSPKSLFSINLSYEGPDTMEPSQMNSEAVKNESDQLEGSKQDSTNPASGTMSVMDEFFPLFGVTLGKTTWKQVEDMGHKVEIFKDGPSRITEVGEINFGDFDGVGVFTSLYWHYYNDSHTDFPPLWKSRGFSWDLSYGEWIDVFRKLGFEIKVTQQPRQREFSGRNTFIAKFEALSPDGILLFTLSFDYGENSYLTSSPKSLYSLKVSYEGSSTEGKNQMSSEAVEKDSTKLEQDGEYYSVTDSPDGGKHVSMGVIVPEEGDEDFEFCSYKCSITDKTQISIITEYMKRFEEGKESRPFLMIGRPCLGLDDIDIFYSLDGEIIFNFIFDDKIKGWIREAGFVLGQVKEYCLYDQDSKLALTLSVSKRKGGEKLYNQASEEAMDFIEEYTVSSADSEVEETIIKAVEDFKKGNSASPYKVIIITDNIIGKCLTLDGDKIATLVDDEIIELAEKNKGAFGYITDVDYDDDGEHKTNVWFTIKVSRSIPRITLNKESEKSDSIEPTRDSSNNSANEANNTNSEASISEEIFAKFISDNIGCDVFNAPNSSWEYETTDFLGNLRTQYETYIFKKPVLGNPKCREIIANVVKGKTVNFSLDLMIPKEEFYDFVYKYKKLFFPDYTLEMCKTEYGEDQYSITTDGIKPELYISVDSGHITFFTNFCNREYIEEQKVKGNIITLQE